MAGSPIRHYRVVNTEQVFDPQCKDYKGDETRAYWFDAIFARVAGGYPITREVVGADGSKTIDGDGKVVTEEVFGEPEALWKACWGYGFNYQTVKAIIHSDPTLRERYKAAESGQADIYAHQMIEIGDKIGTKLDATAAKVKNDARRFMASRLDRAKYGESPMVNLRVGDGDAPLDRETLLLETARGLAFVLSAAGDIAAEKAGRKLLPAPEADVSDAEPA